MTKPMKFSQIIKTLSMSACALLVSATVLANANSASHDSLSQPITKKEINLENNVANRPIKIDLWFKPQQATVKNIAILSHGAMGAAIDYSWLAYPLASQGWTVIGMNHYGESWRYGREHIDPSTVTRFWQRTEDISFVIDNLVQIVSSDNLSDTPNIVVIGHSSGGQTAAALAGVELSFEQMKDYCQSNKSTGDLGCSYAKKGAETKPAVQSTTINNSQDKRIQRIVMLDPALGPAATIESLSKVSVPSLVVGSFNNDFLPFEHHAKYYATHMPKATLVSLNNNEGHFVYLNKCDHPHKAQGVSLCEDRAGVDREQVHRQLLGRIFGFLHR
ncbi:alpha/beta hydrolase family protein [Thalassotalea fusca]